jgi:phosphoglycolate phosphatase
MIRHVLFDFDGTLADSLGLVIRLYNELAERYGYRQIGRANLEELRALSIPDRCRALGVPIYRVPALAMQTKRMYREYLSAVRPADGVPELLRGLKESGVAVTILSSNTAELIGGFLATAELPPFAEVLASRGMFGKHHTLRSWLKRHRTEPEHVLYVGDEHRDAVACGKAGVPMAGVSWGFDAAGLLLKAGAVRVFDRPEELLGWIRERIG